jgi:UDP-2,3-diacylglucosamine hydrolase
MIAIIAGTGALPIAACHALALQNKPFCVISLFPQENSVALRQAAGSSAVINCAFYKAGDILNHLTTHGVKQVLMIGKVDKQQFFKGIKFDWLAVKLLASVAYKNDRDILQRLVDAFAEYGITVLRQHDVLPGLLTKPGIITGTVDARLQNDIDMGMRAAQEISKLDLGQTVIVKNSMVLAVEAIEGTDACIRRGIELGNGEVIICKAAQAAHNPQFDLPTLGSATLQGVEPGQVRAIAWLASHTLIADYENFVAIAQEIGITLISI